MNDYEALKKEYDTTCQEWIDHESLREEILSLVIWWVNTDDLLRNCVAHYANELYKLGK